MDVVACPVPLPSLDSWFPAAEVSAFLADRLDTGKAGHVENLPRPLRQPAHVMLIGVGEGDESGWRAFGAAVARAGAKHPSVSVAIPHDLSEANLRGLAEGVWLAEYRYRLRDEKPEEARKLQRVVLPGAPTDARMSILDTARIVVEQTNFARDLTNTPSLEKTPEWIVSQVRERIAHGVAVSYASPRSSPRKASVASSRSGAAPSAARACSSSRGIPRAPANTSSSSARASRSTPAASTSNPSTECS
jgi:leucyl aminopeptidase